MDLESNPSSGTRSPSVLQVCCARCRTLHRPRNELAFDPLCDACRRSVVDPNPAPRLHPLSDRGVADAIHESSAGTFALGYLDGDRFTAFYVGRADSDLGACLHDWVGTPSRPRAFEASLGAPWLAAAPWRSSAAALGTRRLGRIALGVDTAYTHFMFRYAPSAAAAFERECRDYHALGGSDGLDNPCHPEPPAGSACDCPFHDLSS